MADCPNIRDPQYGVRSQFNACMFKPQCTALLEAAAGSHPVEVQPTGDRFLEAHREWVDAAIRNERRAYFGHNPSNTWLAQTFNNLLMANGTFESDAKKNAQREQRALTPTPLPAAPAVQGWMPIESAPKDGTLFLCWVDAIERGEDDDGNYRESDASCADMCAWIKPHDDEGYFDPCGGPYGHSQMVTHWQPLPAAPATPTGDKP
jgi:hypothetical protein